jgi:L,D-transpeptidase ErfK/SrfK
MRRPAWIFKNWFFFWAVSLLLGVGASHAGAFRYRLPPASGEISAAQTIVGCSQSHTVAPEETLLDIARNYGLGFNEMELLYPHVDPWIPKPGTRLSIPTRWVLPPTRHQGVVVNLPELRLYRFFPEIKMVKTYPVGIGALGWETPEGVYRVVEHEIHPSWLVPPSLRAQYGARVVPPGPQNPLGEYWIGLSLKKYGIHGTNFPWGVGRLVSHGCIRLYPEHIARLFNETPAGTPVEIIYEPVKVGYRNGDIFLEVHPDTYGKVADLAAHSKTRLKNLGIWDDVRKDIFETAIKARNGVPVRIGTGRKGGDRVTTLQAIGWRSAKNVSTQRKEGFQ